MNKNIKLEVGQIWIDGDDGATREILTNNNAGFMRLKIIYGYSQATQTLPFNYLQICELLEQNNSRLMSKLELKLKEMRDKNDN